MGTSPAAPAGAGMAAGARRPLDSAAGLASGRAPAPAPFNQSLAPPDPRQFLGNTSGMGSALVVPPEIARGWNWGAFALPLFWGLAHNTWYAWLVLVLFFCPPVGIFSCAFAALIFGAFGNQWAWQNRQWQSVEQDHAVQRQWAVWGLGLLGAGLGLLVLILLILAAVS